MVVIKKCKFCGGVCFNLAEICGICNKVFQESLIDGLRNGVGEKRFLEIKKEVEENLKKNPPEGEEKLMRY